MSLKDDKQQNIQMQLDFSPAPTGEARKAGREETESSGVTNGPESPANTNRLMELVCERENLKEALRQVKANKSSPGVDGMTVVGITDYLKQHWPTIREQLLNPEGSAASRKGCIGPKGATVIRQRTWCTALTDPSVNQTCAPCLRDRESHFRSPGTRRLDLTGTLCFDCARDAFPQYWPFPACSCRSAVNQKAREFEVGDIWTILLFRRTAPPARARR